MKMRLELRQQDTLVNSWAIFLYAGSNGNGGKRVS